MFNPNIPNTGYRGRPIVIEDDNEDNGGMQVDYAPAQHPQHSFMAYGRVHPIPIPTTTQEPSISVSGPRLTKSTGHNASSARMPSPGYPAWHTTHEQEKKVRSRLREERHAALCVLLDRELLTLQALATQEVHPLKHLMATIRYVYAMLYCMSILTEDRPSPKPAAASYLSFLHRVTPKRRRKSARTASSFSIRRRLHRRRPHRPSH